MASQEGLNHLENVRTPQNLSSSLLGNKSDPILVPMVRFQMLRDFLPNLQKVILGSKLAILFLAIPIAIVADLYHFGRVSLVFVCSSESVCLYNCTWGKLL